MLVGQTIGGDSGGDGDGDYNIILLLLIETMFVFYILFRKKSQ